MCSRSPSIISLKGGEKFIVELKKVNGSLGISVAVSMFMVFVIKTKLINKLNMKVCMTNTVSV